MNVQEALKKYRRVVVVGLSANPDRPSHWIAQYLKDHGFEVVGVNPGMPKVEGFTLYPSVREVPGKLEIVDVFRSPDAIPALMKELIPLKPGVIWLQPGAQNTEAEGTAARAGIPVISGPCIYQEHRRLNP